MSCKFCILVILQILKLSSAFRDLSHAKSRKKSLESVPFAIAPEKVDYCG